MKYSIYLLLFALFSFSNIQAQQIEDEELKKGFEDMEQELSRAFQELNQLFSGSNSITNDTMIMKFFNFPMEDLGGQFNQMMPDSMMMGGMFDMLQNQMRSFSQEDLGELENLFRSFTDQIEMMPMPDMNGKEGQPKEKKKKKRKTTAM